MWYTVGEMARMLGIPASTLRYYDQEGIIPYLERSSGGMRMFTEKDYEWLKVVEGLKKSGLSIKNIRTYIDMVQRGDDSLGDRLTLFHSRKEAVKEKMQELQKIMEFLDFKCWYYETALADGTEERVRSLPLAEIPEKYRDTKAKMNLLDSYGREPQQIHDC